MRLFDTQVALAPFTTFRVGGPARYFYVARTRQDITYAIREAQRTQIPWKVIGGGSNLLVSDEGFPGAIIRNESDAFTWREKDEEFPTLVSFSGAILDELVQETVLNGAWGIENLSGIPGTVGGACVQNAGAYGAEIGDTIRWVEAIDSARDELVRFLRDECAFGYRTSIFKKNPHLIITRLALQLSKKETPNILYHDLAKYFKKRVTPTLCNVREAVLATRKNKFPNLSSIGTAGSFFKNPIISEQGMEALVGRFPDLPQYPQEGGLVKLSAAWLIDKVGGRHFSRQGNVRIYERQALVVVADMGACANDVVLFADEIKRAVFFTTGIMLEEEVEKIGDFLTNNK